MIQYSAGSKLRVADIEEIIGMATTKASAFNQQVKQSVGKSKTAKITPRDIVKAKPEYDLEGILTCLNSKKKSTSCPSGIFAKYLALEKKLRVQNTTG